MIDILREELEESKKRKEAELKLLNDSVRVAPRPPDMPPPDYMRVKPFKRSVRECLEGGHPLPAELLDENFVLFEPKNVGVANREGYEGADGSEIKMP